MNLTFRQQVAIALIPVIYDRIETLTTEEVAKILSEYERVTASEKRDQFFRAFAVLLDEQADAIVKQLDY